ncbi:MAG: proteasome assembly chaperone family protein [Candidatus Micrarchaeota archaeon]|nr:proteasome assembly chaperone family protein [Candidatus Micrarchaeota archaeon]
MIEIILHQKIELKGYTLIEGFPGAGLVGPMAASYMIEKLGMKSIGHIESDLFPPIAAVHGGEPMHTARLYADTKNKLVVVLSEFTIPQHVIYQLAGELLSFVRKNGIGKIVSIGGMPSQNPTATAYVIASPSELTKDAAKAGLKPVNEGVIAGVSALLITGAKEFNIPTIDVLVEVNPLIMDPKYAEVAISGLSKLLDIKIDTAELETEAKEVEARVREMLKKAKESHEHYDKSPEEAGPPAVA